MHLRYDDEFVEAAVFLCASGRRPGAPSLQVRRFHAERERCYTVPDPDDRNAAFFKVHLGWFREWGFEQRLTGVLDEYPLLAGALNVLAFRQARGRNEEGAELYVAANQPHLLSPSLSSAPSGGEGVRRAGEEAPPVVRNAMVALRMDRLERDGPLRCFVRHEFMHLHDMVDPAFGYSPHLHLPEHNQTQQRITRERYRLLWDVTIDGRLTRAGRETLTGREQHQALFERAFSFWPEAKRRQIFESHWNERAPRHAELLALAADPRDLSRAQEPWPGGSCPLCHFPTFEWADLTALAPETLSTLSGQFPGWTAEQGACQRCVEIYELAGRFEIPATMIL